MLSILGTPALHHVDLSTTFSICHTTNFMASVFRRIRLRMQSVKSDLLLLLFDYSHLLSGLDSILVIPLPTWFHVRSWYVWLLLPLPYNPFYWLPIMLLGSFHVNLSLPRCVVLVMNILRTASRLTLIHSLHASQKRAAYILSDSCLTHYWTNSTQRTDWGERESHAPQILFVFHSYSANSWAPTTTRLIMQY